MRTRSHHVALRVEDLERSSRFYTEVFDGRVVLDKELDRGFVEGIFGADPGTTARNRVIVFDGGAIEIFALTPSKALGPTDQTAAGIMHFCLWVDDVVGTAGKVDEAGGRSLFPVRPWLDGHHFVYVADPDGHVIELLDASMDKCVALSARALPHIETSAR